MAPQDRLALIAGKWVSLISKGLGIGAGATWPGEIATSIAPSILKPLADSLSDGVVLVVGTNGKTTTALMLAQILNTQGKRVIHNASGANLLNGLVSSFILNIDPLGRVLSDSGVFEVDENSLPIVLRYIHPKAIVVLNLFRDQLDRYGEVDIIVEKWEKAIQKLPKTTTLILNSDDPGVAHLGKIAPGKVIYFGVNDTSKFLPQAEHATDSTFCPDCGKRLSYEGIYYSHIGIWKCTKCGNKRPVPTVHTFPSALPGLYNQYNTLAAVATAKALGIKQEFVKTSLKAFFPAFGRQEEVVVNGKRVKLFLSKNPAGFNASLRTVLEMGAKEILFVLNDRIPDGRDVSWIWDVDFEMIPPAVAAVATGDRAYDMAVRLKYAKKGDPRQEPVVTYEHIETALKFFTESSDKSKTLYVLATYSGMLEARKILTGKKIL